MWKLLLVLCLYYDFSVGGIFEQRRLARVQIPGNTEVSLQTIQRCQGVSYPSLGCFTLNPPFDNTQWLPQSPESVNTQFFLFTRRNPTRQYILDVDNRTSIIESELRGNEPIKILIHGFLQYSSMEYLTTMTQALLQKSPMNIIVIEWGAGAGFPYSRAVANTRLVAAQASKLLTAIFELTGASPDSVHLIGHSLGAHIAGYIGANIRGISRITGLDPAQPSFSGFDVAARLDSSDAKFVDVIHTDAEPYNTVRGYGIIEPVGHIDFYPNGGRDQPGCQEESSVIGFMEDAISHGINNAETRLSCSHERSAQLFTASILQESCTFTSYPCSSAESFWRGECQHCGNHPCPTMGYQADMYIRSSGSYYLNTTGAQPFCAYHYVITVSLATPTNNFTGKIMVSLKGRTGVAGWFEMTPNDLLATNHVSKLILTQSDIDEVSQVKVRYRSAGGQRTLRFDWIEVNSLMRSPTKYFKQSNMIVGWQPSLRVTSWSYTPPHEW